MAKLYLDAFQALVLYKVDSGITEQKYTTLNTNVNSMFFLFNYTWIKYQELAASR